MEAVEVQRTDKFDEWLDGLADRIAMVKIIARIERMKLGNFGDVAPVGAGVSEIKIDFGPGYRVYFCRSASTIYLLLCGGDKSSQSRDIKRAKRLARELLG